MKLRGYLDRATRHHFSGWAFDEDRPEAALHVVISDNGQVVTRVLANRHRDDLDAFGSGRHSFDIYLPGLCPFHRHLISARVEDADADLEGSPIIIEPSDGFDAEVEAAIGRLIAGADLQTLDRVAGFLAGQVEAVLASRARIQSHETLRHFRWRWFKHRGPPEPDRPPSPPRRALVIDSSQPRYGPEIEVPAVWSYVLSLRRLNYEVSFVSADLARPSVEALEMVGGAGIHCHYAPYVASVEEVLRRQQGTWDVVLINRLANANRYIPLVRHYCSNARIVYACSAASAQVEWHDHTGAASLWRGVDILTPSDDAAAAVGAAIPGANVHTIPWSVPLRPTVVSFERRRGVCLLDAEVALRDERLRSQFEDVMARVWSTHPEIELLIRDAPQLDLPIAFDGRAIVIGADVSTADLFDRLRLTIVASTDRTARRRAAESFGAGVPCVAPAWLLDGIGAPETLRFCDTADPTAFAEAIIALSQDDKRNLHARNLGLDFIDSRHGDDLVDAAIRDLLKRPRRPQFKTLKEDVLVR